MFVSHLKILTNCESLVSGILVPKPVSFPQVPELSTNNTGKRWSDKSSRYAPFCYSSRKQINIVHVSGKSEQMNM